ncbi:MAG: acetyl-CoA C-acetyltransferase [Bdellovibrionales bacterium]|nr:acetyl-CoA C-acetyltransferase [Bdellovibrionales bacterium]
MKGFSYVSHREVVILAGARTPFGAFCGALRHYTATDLGVIASKQALVRSGINADEIDHVIFGNVIQSSPDAAYLARHIGLKSGVPIETPALTLNRLCGSGFEAIIHGAKEILLGEAKFVLAGGTENMTQAPHQIWNAREGIPLGKGKMTDSLWEGLRDSYNGLPMGVTAENLAKKYDIERQVSDQFSLESQEKTKLAKEKGHFKDEIVPIELKRKNETILLEHDEHPRPQTSLEALSKLKPVFDPKGIVTAGSSSGISDGAAAVILTTKEEAERRHLPYLGTLKAYGVVGCDPDFMGIGPAPAARKALLSLEKTVADMDLIEVNEAFAPQVIAVERELGIRRDKLNVNGGAIALGHPLAASGTRICLSLLLELNRAKKRFGLASACIGGGQGIAIIVESAQF